MEFDHHAYLIVGEPKKNREEVLLELKKKLKEDVAGNPDLFFYAAEQFQIDEARELRDKAILLPLVEDYRYIFLDFESITKEAQNAMLKIFEDTPAQTKFFLFTENEGGLIPTFKSRFQIVKGEKEKKESLSKDFAKFYIGEKMEYVKNLCDEISKGKKSRSDAFNFLIELLALNKGRSPKKELAILESLKYIRDRSSSTKLLLESAVLLSLD